MFNVHCSTPFCAIFTLDLASMNFLKCFAFLCGDNYLITKKIPMYGSLDTLYNLCFPRLSENQNIYVFAPVWAACGISQMSTSPVCNCQNTAFLSSISRSGNPDISSKFVCSVANYNKIRKKLSKFEIWSRWNLFTDFTKCCCKMVINSKIFISDYNFPEKNWKLGKKFGIFSSKLAQKISPERRIKDKIQGWIFF